MKKVLLLVMVCGIFSTINAQKKKTHKKFDPTKQATEYVELATKKLNITPEQVHLLFTAAAERIATNKAKMGYGKIAKLTKEEKQTIWKEIISNFNNTLALSPKFTKEDIKKANDLYKEFQKLSWSKNKKKN